MHPFFNLKKPGSKITQDNMIYGQMRIRETTITPSVKNQFHGVQICKYAESKYG